MLTKFHIQNYKALRDVTLDLTPFHVLIGPNDSGKTSVLEAIVALSRSVDHITRDVFPGVWQGHELVWQAKSDLQIQLSATFEIPHASHRYSLSFRTIPSGRNIKVQSEVVDQPSQDFVSAKGLYCTSVCRMIQNGEALSER